MDKSICQKPTKRCDFTPNHINSLAGDEIFVFGSNLAGHHGGGAAFVALSQFGAKFGQGVGLQGQSYAIPTMQGGVETIGPYVDEFVAFAESHPQLFFYVTRIGCGVAGFRDEEIAPLFREAQKLCNVCLPESFVEVLNRTTFIESLAREEWVRIRTLVDIVKTLDETMHFSTFEELIAAFNQWSEQYTHGSPIPEATLDRFRKFLWDGKNCLFEKGKFDIERLQEIVSALEKFYDKVPGFNPTLDWERLRPKC